MFYAVLRFIRRRLVLAVIFFLSLTYCIINLIHNGAPLSLEADDFEVKRQEPLIWQTHRNLANYSINDPTIVCRNSVQGKVLLVDDRGFVCSRPDVLFNGCCNVEADSAKLYSCQTCNVQECCSIYEHCISCCLNPEKKELLERVLAQATGRQIAVFASVKDHFELCLAKCRTDSHSVQHENKYRDPKSKHCYGLTKAYESQRDSVDGPNSVNNNQGNKL